MWPESLEVDHRHTLDQSLVRRALERARPIMIAIDECHRDFDLSVKLSRRDVARKGSINGTGNVRVAFPLPAFHQLVNEVRRQAARVVNTPFKIPARVARLSMAAKAGPIRGARTLLIMIHASRFARSTPGK